MGAAPVGEQLARALPHAELQIVDGGHAPWVHHADQIAPLVTAFLSPRLTATPSERRRTRRDATDSSTSTEMQGDQPRLNIGRPQALIKIIAAVTALRG
ncbi:MAG: hypothetical protein KJN63_11490 [Acidimicrobiia bacterium]|nr:hypothetical protein [Acidimicrobiia bacterium]